MIETTAQINPHLKFRLDDLSISEYSSHKEPSSSSPVSSRASMRRMCAETPPFNWSESTTESARYSMDQKIDRLADELAQAISKRDYETALSLYDKIEPLLPDDEMFKTGLLISKACCFALFEQPSQALSICEALNPSSADPMADLLYFYRGFFHLLDGNLEKGIAAFQKIKNPEREQLAILLVLENRLGVSCINREQTGSSDPQSDFDSEESMTKLMVQGRYAEAIHNIDPRWYEDAAYAGFCHAMLGEWDQASLKLQQAMDLFPSGDVYFVQAAICLLRGDLDKAIEMESQGPVSNWPFPILMLAIQYFAKK